MSATLQTWIDSILAGFQVILLLLLGWVIVVAASRYTERRLRRKGKPGPGIFDSLNWLLDYSNTIGIPILLAGTAYFIWALGWGPGLATGPTAIVLLLMTLAGLLVGLGPSLRR
jgi:hypothetical protein